VSTCDALRGILGEPPRPAGTTLLAAGAALALAAAAWLPLVHFLFRPGPLPPRDRGPIPAAAERLAARHLRLWTDPARLRSELDRMRASNAEWDFMGRSFLVWALGEMCLRDPGRAADFLDGTDHSEFLGRWLATARKSLVHPPTGLLVSSYTFAGDVGDGPEGSSIWLAAHCLRLVDEAFARDQYERARRELAGRLCGFGFAREWPASWRGAMDVDSGPIIPVLGISAGSSGLALVGARSFDDADFFRALLTSLDFAGFPIREDGTLKYGASNQVGDSVMLYALVLGPVWDRILAGKAADRAGTQ